MPIDGIAIACLTHQLKAELMGARVEKCYQPERDEVLLHIRGGARLLISACSAHPRLHLTDKVKENPQKPPMFCMLLRKHLAGGRIVDVVQDEFERVVRLIIESHNEMGDLTRKTLVAEIMGKHSNIILIDADNRIIDAVKHIDLTVSSLRMVLPGLKYEPPPSQGKLNPLLCERADILAALNAQAEGEKADRALVNAFMGVSPLAGREMCFRAFDTADIYVQQADLELLSAVVYEFFCDVKNGFFYPSVFKAGRKSDFAAFKVTHLPQGNHYEAFSQLLTDFYVSRDMEERMKQRAYALQKTVGNLLERARKKLLLHQDKLKEGEKKDKYKIFGDLITANIYRINADSERLVAENYYEQDSPSITIPLDSALSPAKNAQRYYSRYNKLKTAERFAAEQMELTLADIAYLETVAHSIETSAGPDELAQIRRELEEQGYVKPEKKAGKQGGKRMVKEAAPLSFAGPDGFEILVGRNNKQNDYLTMRMARSPDMWLHVRNMPGSHVVIKTNGREVSAAALEQAAALAAYHSRAQGSAQVPVDYTLVKHVKKPPGAKPGMVIYEDFKTMYITPSPGEPETRQ